MSPSTAGLVDVIRLAVCGKPARGPDFRTVDAAQTKETAVDRDDVEPVADSRRRCAHGHVEILRPDRLAGSADRAPRRRHSRWRRKGGRSRRRDRRRSRLGRLHLQASSRPRRPCCPRARTPKGSRPRRAYRCDRQRRSGSPSRDPVLDDAFAGARAPHLMQRPSERQITR